MARGLVFNDDGSITIPLAPVDRANPEARSVTLPEPTMDELSMMVKRVDEADHLLPAAPEPIEDPTPEQLVTATKALRDRTLASFGDESPHGQALIDVIKQMTGENYSRSDFYGWAMHPRTMAQILSQFQSPLPGPESE